MATQGRQITAEEFQTLGQLGVLGDKVELLNGWIVHGRYPFAFSEQALAAARDAGIELDPPEQGPTYRLASLGTPAAGEDAETLAVAALIKHADIAAIRRAEHDLAHGGAERNDIQRLAAADLIRRASRQRCASDQPERRDR